MSLKNKNAIVTGGATGIGKAISLKLSELGANVVVADINREAAESTADELSERSIGFECDVTDIDRIQRMVEHSVSELGSIDILVNNAGIAGASGWFTRAESTEEDWKATYQVNVIGIQNVTAAASDHMKKRREGKIVNLASIAGREGRPSLPHYSASKAAVINLTQSIAIELARYNINVNAICPGLLWTPMWEQVGGRYARDIPAYEGLEPKEVFYKMIEDRIPMGTEQTPEDVADATAFLVSDDALNITGQALNVDGGFFMR